MSQEFFLLTDVLESMELKYVEVINSVMYCPGMKSVPGCGVDGEYTVTPNNQADQHHSTEQDEPKEQESAQIQPLVVMQTLSLSTTCIPLNRKCTIELLSPSI